MCNEKLGVYNHPVTKLNTKKVMSLLKGLRKGTNDNDTNFHQVWFVIPGKWIHQVGWISLQYWATLYQVQYKLFHNGWPSCYIGTVHVSHNLWNFSSNLFEIRWFEKLPWYPPPAVRALVAQNPLMKRISAFVLFILVRHISKLNYKTNVNTVQCDSISKYFIAFTCFGQLTISRRLKINMFKRPRHSSGG
jgi:hypothetical protein